MPLITGQMLNNRYRIVKLLGQGGFGTVYKAWDLNLNGTVEVKENFDTSLYAQKQFTREASILFNMRHPNLPRVSDHFSVPGLGQYLVMDYVEGDDLQELLDHIGKPLPESQILNWIEQICEALSYLHNQNPPIIHRDIKPANIKITKQGMAILVDFGIAKVFDPMVKTTIGARAATPGFAPYEQYGHALTDNRSDIYSIGATLYTLLTGHIPIDSISRVGTDHLIPPCTLNPAITRNTEQVILRAMAVMPDQRYNSVSELKIALLPAVQSPLIISTLPITQTALLTQVVAQQSINTPIDLESSTSLRVLPKKTSNKMLKVGVIIFLLLILFCCIGALGVWLWNNGEKLIQQLNIQSLKQIRLFF